MRIRLFNGCLVERLEARQLFSTFTVTSTANSGAGTLRQAILDANAAAGADTIVFAVTGTGVKTITPTAALPDITSQVLIDGTTQTGYAGTPLVEIVGSGTPNGTTLLVISAGSTTLRGLVIRAAR